MTFFSSEISDQLQLVTFPLEVFGLTLALVEVRFPRMANAVAERIRIESIAFQKGLTMKSKAISWLLPFLPSGLRTRLVSMLILLFPFIVLFVAPIDPITLPLVSVLAVIVAIWASVRWIPDKPVGTLGIFVAGLGVLGEGYQFTVQLTGI